MKDSLSLIKRYASCLYLNANANNLVEKTNEEFSNINLFISKYPILINPKTPYKYHIRLWEEVSKVLKLNTVTINFILLLLKNKRIHLIQSIAEKFYDIALFNQGVERVKVESAEELSEDMKSKLVKKLKEVLKKDIVLEVRLDPALIGGIVLIFDFLMFDGSLKTKLEKIKFTLLS